MRAFEQIRLRSKDPQTPQPPPGPKVDPWEVVLGQPPVNRLKSAG